MKSNKTNRVFLWGFPVLIVFSLLLFEYTQSLDQSYHEARKALGWKTYPEGVNFPVAERSRDYDFIERKNGLYVFLGPGGQQVPYDLPVNEIVVVTFDDQNNLWVATKCGGIRKFVNNAWETYREEVYGPAPHPESCAYSSIRPGIHDRIDGIFIDHENRIWIWNYYSIKVFDGSTWRTLTFENSGIAGYYINELAVDNFDRVWVSAADGVSMIAVKEMQTLPQGIVDRRNVAVALGEFMTRNRFLPVALWIITLLNMNVWSAVLVVSSDNQFIQKASRLAKTSLRLGNLSFIASWLLSATGMIQECNNDGSCMLQLLVASGLILVTFIFSLPSLITAANALGNLKKGDVSSDNGIKKMAQRGAILGGLGIVIPLLAYLILNLSLE